MQTFNLPKYSKVVYLLNPVTRYYTQKETEAQETPINRLPLEIRLAPTGAAQIKPNADKMLLSRAVNGKYSFRTGIQGTFFNGWYVGNDFEYYRGQKVISLMLFHFTDNDTRLEVYYFHRYDKKNTYFRMQFANDTIPLFRKETA